MPFRVTTKLADGKFRVYGEDYVRLHRPSSFDRHGGPVACCGGDYGPEMVWLNAHGGDKIRVEGRTLYVPEDSKLMELEKPSESSDTMNCCVSGDSYQEQKKRDDERAIFDKVLMPGNLLDLEMRIAEKTAALKLYVTPNEASINNGPMQSKSACILSLVCEHGLRERTAKQMLKEAEAQSRLGTPSRYRVMYAPEYPLSKEAYGFSGPAVPDEQTPSGFFGNMPSHTDSQQLIQSSPTPVDPSVYDMAQDPMQSTQLAQQASQMGQREIFDTSMLSGLLKSVRQDSAIAKYSTDLLKALDRLGRILFIFYWRNEYFADRYGKGDLPELEDSIRNSFDSLGDLTLFLLEKDSQPLFGDSRHEIGVDDTAEI